MKILFSKKKFFGSVNILYISQSDIVFWRLILGILVDVETCIYVSFLVGRIAHNP